MDSDKKHKETLEDNLQQAESITVLSTLESTESETSSNTESGINEDTGKLESFEIGNKILSGHSQEANAERLTLRTRPTLVDKSQSSEGETSKGAARREHLKKARYNRFKSGNSEISLKSTGKKETLKDSKQSADDIEMSSDSEIDWFLDEDDDEDIFTQSQPAAVDTIKAKMDFLKCFEIPSLSDISEDFSDFQLNEDRETRTKNLVSENVSLFNEDEEEEEEDVVQKPLADSNTIKAKNDFLKSFKMPSLSDISEDGDDA